jgi:hypothetical protein
MAVERDDRPGLELDQIQHPVGSEQRAAADTVRKSERADVLETDEAGLHGQRIIVIRRPSVGAPHEALCPRGILYGLLL